MSTKTSKPATEATESLITRTVLAPVLFISFLFSLFLIDRKTSAEIFSSSDTSGERKSSTSSDHYYHTNQRRLAKEEIDRAFALRRRVIAAMCVLSAVGLAVAAWCVIKAWEIWVY